MVLDARCCVVALRQRLALRRRPALSALSAVPGQLDLLTAPDPVPCAFLPPTTPPAGPGIFAGRLTEGQRRLMESSPDVPPLGGRFGGPPGSGSVVTPQLVLTGRP